MGKEIAATKETALGLGPTGFESTTTGPPLVI
jgi:hypothetical protein